MVLQDQTDRHEFLFFSIWYKAKFFGTTLFWPGIEPILLWQLRGAVFHHWPMVFLDLLLTELKNL